MGRTAVVFELNHADGGASAMMAERVAAVVSPGTAIMSRPTERTQVWPPAYPGGRPSRRGGDHALVLASAGMKAPDRPPTWGGGPCAPFFTASLNLGPGAAVVPWVPRV